MNTPKKIIIIESSNIITDGLSNMFDNLMDFEVVGTFDQTDKANDFLSNSDVDIIIANPLVINHSLKTSNNAVMFALIYQYINPNQLKAYPNVIDIHDTRQKIEEKLKHAFLSENENPDNKSKYELSERETEILVLVAKGLQNKEIAEKLFISIHTVISHRKNIVAKTGIKSVAGLTVYALVNNLIEEKEL